MRVVVGSLRLPSHWLRQGAVLILLQPVELALLLPLPGWPAHCSLHSERRLQP